MKSTYKLFGVVWDGLEEGNQIPNFNCEHPVNSKAVSLRELLCTFDEYDVKKLLEPFHDSETVAIDMDYCFENENPIMKAFIEKRIRQIRRYISKKFKTVYNFQDIKEKSH